MENFVYNIETKFSTQGFFWDCWLRIRAKRSEIQNGGYNKADQNAKSYFHVGEIRQ